MLQAKSLEAQSNNDGKLLFFYLLQHLLTIVSLLGMTQNPVARYRHRIDFNGRTSGRSTSKAIGYVTSKTTDVVQGKIKNSSAKKGFVFKALPCAGSTPGRLDISPVALIF